MFPTEDLFCWVNLRTTQCSFFCYLRRILAGGGGVDEMQEMF